MELPLQYILEVFFQYVGNPKYKSYANVYYGSCPVCREGKSWLKKKRLSFLVSKNFLYCQNCQRGWSPFEWIKEVTGKDYNTILEEAKEFDSSIEEIINRHKKEEVAKKPNTHTLPFDSINLFDTLQVKYHLKEKVVVDCLRYIQNRRLDTAINRPRTFYVSLKDFVHKNRLVIPFTNREGKIAFYQTRAIYKEDEEPAKYLSKINGEKTVFGIDKIDENFDYLFIFEGPINAMFAYNGLAMGGIQISELQAKELEVFRFHKKIWVLDNPFVDEPAREKIENLIERNETVFIMPQEFRQYKDINDLCIAYNNNKVGTKFIVENSFKGMNALLRLKA